MPATCQIALTSGNECGVTAIGRCDKCERGLCSSHRGVSQLHGLLLNRCQACADAEARSKQDAVYEGQRRLARQEKEDKETARTIGVELAGKLRQAGVPTTTRTMRLTVPGKRFRQQVTFEFWQTPIRLWPESGNERDSGGPYPVGLKTDGTWCSAAYPPSLVDPVDPRHWGIFLKAQATFEQMYPVLRQS